MRGLNDARPRRLRHPDFRDHRRDADDYHRRANDPGFDLIILPEINDDRVRSGLPSAEGAPPRAHSRHGMPRETDEACLTP